MIRYIQSCHIFTYTCNQSFVHDTNDKLYFTRLFDFRLSVDMTILMLYLVLCRMVCFVLYKFNVKDLQ